MGTYRRLGSRGLRFLVVAAISLTLFSPSTASADQACYTGEAGRSAGSLWRTLTAQSGVRLLGVRARIDVQRPRTSSGNYSEAYVELKGNPATHPRSAINYGIRWRDGQQNGVVFYYQRLNNGTIYSGTLHEVGAWDLPYLLEVRLRVVTGSPGQNGSFWDLYEDGVYQGLSLWGEWNIDMKYARTIARTSSASTQLMGGTTDWLKFTSTQYRSQYGTGSLGGPVSSTFANWDHVSYHTNGSEFWVRDDDCKF